MCEIMSFQSFQKQRINPPANYYIQHAPMLVQNINNKTCHAAVHDVCRRNKNRQDNAKPNKQCEDRKPADQMFGRSSASSMAKCFLGRRRASACVCVYIVVFPWAGASHLELQSGRPGEGGGGGAPGNLSGTSLGPPSVRPFVCVCVCF